MRMLAGITALRAASRAVDACAGQARTTALDGASFEAGSPFAALQLCVFGAPPTRHAADAALVLHACEPLLESLHAWTGLDLDWRWTGRDLDWRWTVASHARAVCPDHAVVTWRPDAEVYAVAALPWPLLRSLPPPPAALSRAFHWSPVTGVLALSRFALDADEASRLEPGGAVLLPESMRPAWHARLRAADEPPGVGAGVAMELPGMPRLVRAPATDTAAPWPPRPGDCEVRMTLHPPLAADRCTGWLDGEPLGELPQQAALWRLGVDGMAARRLAAGRLMPWGDGWALAIETLEAPHEAD